MLRNHSRSVSAVLVAAFALAWMGACASLPTVSYLADGDAGVVPGRPDPSSPDATLPADGAGGTPIGDDDAAAAAPVDAAADVPQIILIADDDGGPITGLMCGDAGVGSCAKCPGMPLICKTTNGNTCVATCDDCAVGALPCWHCPASGKIRGVCASVNGKGVLNCSSSNPCACDAAADCPSAEGALDVCGSATSSCLTCGQTGTNGEPCALLDGGTGHCTAGGAPSPSCQ